MRRHVDPMWICMHHRAMPRDRSEFLEDHVDRPATIDELLAEAAADPSAGFSPSATLRDIREELDR